MRQSLLLALALLACDERAPTPPTPPSASSTPLPATIPSVPGSKTVSISVASATSASVAPEPTSAPSARIVSAPKVPVPAASPQASAPQPPTSSTPGLATTGTVLEGSAEAFAQQVDALFGPLPRYQAKFIQKFRPKVGAAKESRGIVLVERPHKISFRYEPPNKNRIVSDGTTLKVYIESDSQMFEHPVDKSEYPGALAFVMGKGISPSFTFQFREQAKFDRGPVLWGKPRQPSPHYESVLFYVDKAKLHAKDLGAMSGVLIEDAQGNRNRFEFFDAAEPKSVEASEFVFTAPAGTNVTK